MRSSLSSLKFSSHIVQVTESVLFATLTCGRAHWSEFAMSATTAPTRGDALSAEARASPTRTIVKNAQSKKRMYVFGLLSVF